MNMILNMNNGRAIFFSKFKTVIHEIITVKSIFYPATIKNDNGAIAKRMFLCDTNGTNNSTKLKKGLCS